MSAYLCDDKHISQIADFLCYHNGVFHPSYWRSGHTPEVIAQRLYEMNCAALGARYGDRYETGSKVQYVSSTLHVPLGQTLKSLECFRYQCSEGEVPKTELYEMLTRAIDALMGEILQACCPEYRNGKWGAYEPAPDAPKVYSISAMMREKRS